MNELAKKYIEKMKDMGFEMDYNHQMPTREEILLIMILEKLEDKA